MFILLGLFVLLICCVWSLTCLLFIVVFDFGGLIKLMALVVEFIVVLALLGLFYYYL